MVAHAASTFLKSVFALEDFQCRGCEPFQQVEPFCGRPARKIPNDVRDHRAVGEQWIYTGSAAVESRKGPRSIVCVPSISAMTMFQQQWHVSICWQSRLMFTGDGGATPQRQRRRLEQAQATSSEIERPDWRHRSGLWADRRPNAGREPRLHPQLRLWPLR